MARVFITGSADGLGQLAAKELIKLGNHVVLHARSAERGEQALAKVPGAADVLIADLSSIEQTMALAAKANTLGSFDAVIHNAGIYQVPKNSMGKEGLPLLLTVNTLGPYILTCLMNKPKRLIYMSSGMHLQGNADLGNSVPAKDYVKSYSYADTKLHDLILAKAVSRKWTGMYSNAVNPGWVPTKMGGASAPDSLEEGFQTQVWLAVSNDPAACVSGHYFHHQKQARYQQIADDADVQEQLLAYCKHLTGVSFPF